MEPGIADGFRDVGRLEPDNLIGGEFPRVSMYVTLTGALQYTQGAVLGEVTASENTFQLSVAAATDGSQVPTAILAEDVDTRTGDVLARVYISGEFNKQLANFGAGHTLASVTRALRERSIFLRDNQSA